MSHNKSSSKISLILIFVWLAMFWTNVGLTLPLWVKTNLYPWIPFTRLFQGIPFFGDSLILGLLILSHLWLLVSAWKSAHKPDISIKPFPPNSIIQGPVPASFLSAILLLLLGILNVERFQTWMWQSFLLHTMFVIHSLSLTKSSSDIKPDSHGNLISSAETVPYLVLAFWLTGSIYFFSACSKFTLSYHDGIGRQFIQQLDKMIPIIQYMTSILSVEASHRFLLIAIPAYELIIAILFVRRKTMIYGVVGSLIMHAVLILTLGPTGANQKTPVLIWNLYFIIQNIILYLWLKSVNCHQSETTKVNPGIKPDLIENRSPWLSCPQHLKLHFANILVLALPVLYWFNFYDAWLGWSLYSPSQAVVKMEFPAEVTLQGVVSIDESEMHSAEFYRTYNLQTLALEANGAPMIPAEFYRMAIARWYALKSKSLFHVSLYRSLEYHHRMKGPEQSQVLNFSSLEDLENYANHSPWNLEPR